MAKEVQYSDPSRQGDRPPDPELDNESNESASKFVSGLDSIKEQHRKSKRNKIIFISIIVILLLAVGGYFGFKFLNKEPAPQQQAQETSQEDTNQNEQTAPVEEYNSRDLQLSLEYPGNWEVDDSEIGKLLITSPETALTDAIGNEVQGKVVFTIVNAGGDIPGFVIDGGTAAIASEKITYTRPSQNQRKQTHITLVAFEPTGVEAVYVTGDNGYKKDQFVPKSDVAKIEPNIAITFVDSSGELLSISADEWGVNPVLVAAAEIIKSLQID